MNKASIEILTAFLETSKNIAIIGHKGPDGDAIGSTLALHFFLKKLGHNTTVIVPNDFPDFLKWLPDATAILVFEKDPTLVTKTIHLSDLIFTLDFNSLDRVGDIFKTILEAAQKPFVLIDHHQQPDDYATYSYSDVTMGSTAQMVFHFMEMMNAISLLDKTIATCIYTGIVTDSGSFKFSNTNALTHRVTAQLFDSGIDHLTIHQNLFDTNSPQRMQLLGVALQNLVILPEYKTSYITLTQEDLDNHHFQKGDTEGFVNYGLAIKDIELAVIFIEHKQENVIKISFRSKSSFDVNVFARNHFEGGGHMNAAGGKSNLNMQETISFFISKLHGYKNELIHA